MKTAFQNSKRDQKAKRTVNWFSKFPQQSKIILSVKGTYNQICNDVWSSTTRLSRDALSVRDLGISGKSVVRKKSVRDALKLNTAIGTDCPNKGNQVKINRCINCKIAGQPPEHKAMYRKCPIYIKTKGRKGIMRGSKKNQGRRVKRKKAKRQGNTKNENKRD